MESRRVQPVAERRRVEPCAEAIAQAGGAGRAVGTQVRPGTAVADLDAVEGIVTERGAYHRTRSEVATWDPSEIG